MAVLPPPPPQVEAVVVHAPRLAPLGGEAVFSVIQITPEVLETQDRLDQALKSAPGVSLFRRTDSAAANPTTQGVSLRAIAPSGAGRALVTLDGAPQNDPFGGWVIWSALPPEVIGSATVVRGAGAGPYGAGALTGVIALTEKDARAGLLDLEASAGQRDSYRGAVVAGFPNALFSAAASRTDGYYAVRGAQRGAADERLRMDDASASLRVQGDLGEVQGAVRLSAYQANQQAGIVGARSNARGAAATVTLAQPAREGVGGWRLQGWVRASNLENSSAAVAQGRTGSTPANDQYDTPATGYGLNAAFQGRNGPLAWEVGADVRLTDGTEHERFRYMNGAFTRDREAGGKTLVAGAYVEAAYAEGPWTATGGVRLDRSRAYDAIRRERDTTTGEVLLDQHAPGRSDTTPTGRIGLRYAVSEALYLRGAAYAGFRAPTLNELHRPFRVGNDITEANPELKPETLQGAEFGLGGEGPVRWSADVFWNRLKDPIANVTIGFGPGNFPTAGFVSAGGTLRQRRNAGEIRAWGVEGEASGDIGTMIAWRAAMAYTDAVVRGGADLPQLTGLRPAQTPKWTLTGGFDLRPIDPLRLSADLRYESARWEDDLNSRRLSAGLQVDARAAWRLTDAAEAYVAVDNLFDSKLEVGETGDGVESFAAARTVRIGFSYRR
jgi:outer membrane receptor protein involved in Fe transport